MAGVRIDIGRAIEGASSQAIIGPIGMGRVILRFGGVIIFVGVVGVSSVSLVGRLQKGVIA